MLRKHKKNNKDHIMGATAPDFCIGTLKDSPGLCKVWYMAKNKVNFLNNNCFSHNRDKPRKQTCFFNANFEIDQFGPNLTRVSTQLCIKADLQCRSLKNILVKTSAQDLSLVKAREPHTWLWLFIGGVNLDASCCLKVLTCALGCVCKAKHLRPSAFTLMNCVTFKRLLKPDERHRNDQTTSQIKR